MDVWILGYSCMIYGFFRAARCERCKVRFRANGPVPTSLSFRCDGSHASSESVLGLLKNAAAHALSTTWQTIFNILTFCDNQLQQTTIKQENRNGRRGVVEEQCINPSSQYSVGSCEQLHGLNILAGGVKYILGSYWVQIGFKMDSYWIYIGFILDSYWIYIGFILDSYWIHIGFILDSYWIHIGFKMDSYWIHIGFKLDSYWIQIGFRLDSAWIQILVSRVHGLFFRLWILHTRVHGLFFRLWILHTRVHGFPSGFETFGKNQ